MNKSETGNTSFFDTFPTDISFDQFQVAISQVIGEEESELLGEKASELIAESLAYLGAFAPEPATFDLQAVASVTGLNEEEAFQVTNFAVQKGLLKKHDDRYMMEAKIKNLFRSFLT